MDISSFMTGYFVGLVAGAGVFIWWTYKFGRFLPDQWPLTRQNIANRIATLRRAKEDPVHFATRRENRSITPAE